MDDNDFGSESSGPLPGSKEQRKSRQLEALQGAATGVLVMSAVEDLG